jgi:hypothetical protein
MKGVHPRHPGRGALVAARTSIAAHGRVRARPSPLLLLLLLLLLLRGRRPASLGSGHIGAVHSGENKLAA